MIYFLMLLFLNTGYACINQGMYIVFIEQAISYCIMGWVVLNYEDL